MRFVASPMSLPRPDMLANKTGTITKGSASRPQIRNMIANEATRRKRKASNLIDVMVYRAG